MPYRIDVVHVPAGALLAFQGLLDSEALLDLEARLRAPHGPTRVVLRRGTEVDPRCIGALRRLRVDGLSAESPFLARWLSEVRP
jgi:hypothetical protein